MLFFVCQWGLEKICIVFIQRNCLSARRVCKADRASFKMHTRIAKLSFPDLFQNFLSPDFSRYFLEIVLFLYSCVEANMVSFKMLTINANLLFPDLYPHLTFVLLTGKRGSHTVDSQCKANYGSVWRQVCNQPNSKYQIFCIKICQSLLGDPFLICAGESNQPLNTRSSMYQDLSNPPKGF